MSSAGSPIDVNTIIMDTMPACGIPAAPVLAAVTIKLKEDDGCVLCPASDPQGQDNHSWSPQLINCIALAVHGFTNKIFFFLNVILYTDILTFILPDNYFLIIVLLREKGCSQSWVRLLLCLPENDNLAPVEVYMINLGNE